MNSVFVFVLKVTIFTTSTADSQSYVEYVHELRAISASLRSRNVMAPKVSSPWSTTV